MLVVLLLKYSVDVGKKCSWASKNVDSTDDFGVCEEMACCTKLVAMFNHDWGNLAATVTFAFQSL